MKMNLAVFAALSLLVAGCDNSNTFEPANIDNAVVSPDNAIVADNTLAPDKSDKSGVHART